MSDAIRPGRVFGTWDAPITDEDHEPGETPLGAECVWCQERIQPGDNGRIAPVFSWDNAPMGGHVEHRECAFRNVMGGIGHLVDHNRYCEGEKGPDAGLTRRQSSLLVWEYFQDTHLHPTEAQLVRWRQRIEMMR